MTRDILMRLRKLESQRPRQQTEQERIGNAFSRFLMVNVAFHLGNPTRDEAPATAYARALGYESGFDFRMALKGKDPTLNKRVASAKFSIVGEIWRPHRF